MRACANLAAAVALFAAGGGLSGCGLPTERPRMTWRLAGDELGQARLVLGAPGTDRVRLTMTCRPRSGAVVVTLIGRLNDPAVAELHSGEVWTRYAGAGHLDEATGRNMDIDFQIPADAPVLQRLADTGQLSIVLPDRRIVLPNAFAPAHDFLVLCRSR
jgi:hypothetical protein